jgi:hypothetical protein
VKAVSGAISEWAESQFSLTVYESTGAVGAYESIRPHVKAVSGGISEWAASQFSLTV